MNLIATSKYGDCDRCGDKDTECRKRKKEMLCLSCCKIEDTKKQVTKANQRNQVRGLYGKQVESGKEDMASRQALISDIDYVFSRIVRLRAADEYGNCECFTCGAKKHWSLMQCGHFVKRGNMALRFDFRNSRVQDKHCNETLGGNYDLYKQRLEEEQTGLSEQLEEEGRIVFKYGTDELKQLLIDLRAKLKPLEDKFNPIKK